MSQAKLTGFYYLKKERKEAKTEKKMNSWRHLATYSIYLWGKFIVLDLQDMLSLTKDWFCSVFHNWSIMNKYLLVITKSRT